MFLKKVNLAPDLRLNSEGSSTLEFFVELSDLVLELEQ